MRDVFLLVLIASVHSLAHAQACEPAIIPRPIAIYQTNLNKGEVLVREPAGEFGVPVPSSAAIEVLNVNENIRFQKMRGFGGALTEASAINLLRLPEDLRQQALESLFRKGNGAGFDYIRLPVGASDFTDPVAGNYTYDDATAADSDLAAFSVARDEKSFALIRQALAINPDLHVIVSPWSPPAWMKAPSSLLGGKLAADHGADLAKYLVHTVQELIARGVPVESLTIQNEPGYPNDDYPSMGMDPLEQAAFIRDSLGPEMKRASLRTDVFVLDHNYNQFDDVNQILSDPAVRAVVRGVAYHCYEGDYTQMNGSISVHPDAEVFQTECTGMLDGQDPSTFPWWLSNYTLSPSNLGSTGSLAWNLVLDETGGPHNGGCVGCAGLITTDFSGAVPVLKYAPEYHALAQVSAFVHRGAERIEVTSPPDSDLNYSAFRNLDGEVNLVTWNKDDNAKAIRIERGACEAFEYTLPGKTAVTFQWDDHLSAPMM